MPSLVACRLSRWLRQGSPAQAEALGLFHAYDQGDRGVIATEEARPAHSLPQLNMRLCAMAPRSLKMCERDAKTHCASSR